jgi:hypothetical protein
VAPLCVLRLSRPQVARAPRRAGRAEPSASTGVCCTVGSQAADAYNMHGPTVRRPGAAVFNTHACWFRFQPERRPRFALLLAGSCYSIWTACCAQTRAWIPRQRGSGTAAQGAERACCYPTRKTASAPHFFLSHGGKGEAGVTRGGAGGQGKERRSYRVGATQTKAVARGAARATARATKDACSTYMSPCRPDGRPEPGEGPIPLERAEGVEKPFGRFHCGALLAL